MIRDCRWRGPQVNEPQVDVFVNPQGQPQHLAVQNERKADHNTTETYRTVCGQQGTGHVQQRSPTDLQFECKDCNEQLKLWKDVNT